jgi:uncharacterized Fe-S cluster-containing radical SAM superfamily protein
MRVLTAALYNPIKLASEIEKIVTVGVSRKYYRVARPGRWYGGIATADSRQASNVADAA